MIDKALAFVVDRLNAALQQHYPDPRPHAVVAGLGGPDTASVENKIILSIANIERETGTQASLNYRPDATGYARTAPPLHVNVLILVAANFGDNYAEALKFLSSALMFFQSSSVMIPANYAAFPPGLERLTIEFVNLTFQELNSLWSIRGSRYLPSFLLKLRTVTIAAADVQERATAITGLETGASS